MSGDLHSSVGNCDPSGRDRQSTAAPARPRRSVPSHPTETRRPRECAVGHTLDEGRVVERVHVIEDDRSVRSALVNLISASGFEAASYDSVDAFLSEGADVPAGCFLLDVRLPGLSGLDFLSEMNTLDLHLPVILISGHGDVPITVQGMRAGAIDFLTKPFQPRQVLDAVARAMDLDRGRRRILATNSDVLARYGSLSRRERQVMGQVTAGKMNKQIAGDLGLSEITVKVYRAALMRKMGTRTLAGLVRLAEQLETRSPEVMREDA